MHLNSELHLINPSMEYLMNAALAVVQAEANAKAWNIGDSKFDSIVSKAESAMSATQLALVYALSQALENGNSNKINEFFGSELCTKAELCPKFKKKMAAWSVEQQLAAIPSAPRVRKQVAQGGTLLSYLRHHGILAHHEISDKTGEKEYIEGPLTFSGGKFSFTKEDESAGTMHWRTQLAMTDGDTGEMVWDLDQLFSQMVSENWWQFLKAAGGKNGLDLNKSLKSLAKRAIKAAEDDGNDSISYMSEQTFIDAAQKAYRELMAESAK